MTNDSKKIEFYILIKPITMGKYSPYPISSIFLKPQHEAIINAFPDHFHICDGSLIPDDLPELKAVLKKKTFPDMKGLNISVFPSSGKPY